MKVIHGVLKKTRRITFEEGGGRETAIAARASAIAVSGVGQETGVGQGWPWGHMSANAISKPQSAFRSKIMSLEIKTQLMSNPSWVRLSPYGSTTYKARAMDVPLT
jgi:hypothetical protein